MGTSNKMSCRAGKRRYHRVLKYLPSDPQLCVCTYMYVCVCIHTSVHMYCYFRRGKKYPFYYIQGVFSIVYRIPHPMLRLTCKYWGKLVKGILWGEQEGNNYNSKQSDLEFRKGIYHIIKLARPIKEPTFLYFTLKKLFL